MPKEAIADVDQYQKDKETFGEAVDHVLAADPEKTDEELLAEMEKLDAEGEGEAGEATKDPDKDATDDAQAVDPTLFGVSPETDSKAVEKDDEATDPKPDSDDTDWKAEAERLTKELDKEKQKTSSWNGRITAANKRADEAEAKLEEALKAKPKADGDEGTESDEEKLEKFGNDFPELKGAIDILLKKVDANKTPVKDTVKTDPIKEEPESTDDDLSKAQAEIRAQHPDLDEAVNSGVLLTWINQQADFIRPTLQAIYQTGTPAEVIKMVTEFKNKSGWTSQLAKDKTVANTTQEDKLKNMVETNSTSGGAPTDGPDKNDFNGAAEEAFSEKS